MRVSEQAASALAFSPLTQILARRLPVRGGSRLVYEGYRRTAAASRPKPTTTVSVFGDRFQVDFDSWLEWQVWAFGTYEKQLGEFLGTILRPGDTALDIGANFGVHTIRMAKLVGASGLVIAVEAAPSVAQRLTDNVKLNGLSNVQVVQSAVTETSGDDVTLHEPAPDDPNKGRASLLGHEYLTGETHEVSTVTVDNLVSGPIRLMKIDVEGAEIGVLNGAKNTISTHRPVVIFEFNHCLVKSGLSPLDYFRPLDYELLVMMSSRHPVTGATRLLLVKPDSAPAGNLNILAMPHSA